LGRLDQEYQVVGTDPHPDLKDYLEGYHDCQKANAETGFCAAEIGSLVAQIER